MSVWYCRDNSGAGTGWSAVTAWSAGASISAGALRRQTAPSVGNERVFVAIGGGTTGGTEPTWTVTKGAKTTDNTVTWQECTGQPGVNGDMANTPASSTVRSTAQSLGKIIKDNAGTHLFICSTAGTSGASEPSYNTAAIGNTTADGTATWTYIGTSFSAWAAPHARLQAALASTWAAAGDDVYIADDHSQTQSTSISLTSQGTNAAPTNIWCVDHTVALPASGSDLRSDPYTTASPACAQITTTGNTGIGMTGIANYYGIVFSASSGSSSGTVTCGQGRYKRCSFRRSGTLVAAITLGLGDAVDCSMQFGTTGDSVRPSTQGRSRWLQSSSGAVIGAFVPTTLIGPSGISGSIILDGLDLSALGSGCTIFGAMATDTAALMVNCKLGANVTIGATPTARLARWDAVSADSAGVAYSQASGRFEGTLTQETAIVRTGGATDGATPLSWKIVTTANSQWVLPFESFPIAIWNDVVGSSRTLTVYGIWGSGAVPNNDDIWIEVEYMGDSGSPLASVVTSTKANALTSGSALPSDGSTWGGSTTAFKMSVTFTAQLAGYVRCTVKAAKASSTFYIDPKPVLS